MCASRPAWRSLVLLVAVVGAGAAVVRADDEKVTFDDNVLAVLRQRCGTCHNADKKAGGLDVTTYTGLMQGGGSGSVLEAGDASASYLYRLVTQEDEPKMPPDSPPIPEEERALLKRWIDGGILENKGSKAAPKKKSIAMAMDAAPTERPAQTPVPARIPLEPVVRTRVTNACSSIATSPWAPLAAICGQKQVLLYRTDTRQIAGVLPFPEGLPQTVQFSRNGSLVLAGGGRGGASGKVVLWSVASGRRVAEVGDEVDTVLAADISANHRLVALGGPQRVVRIHSSAGGPPLHELRKHTDWITAVGFSPDGVLLATADRNGGVVVWESETGRDYLVLAGHTGAVTAVSWRPDSNLLATGSEDGTIRLWELENGSQVKSWNAHGGGVAALEFTRDGRIVSIGRDKTPKIWAQDGSQQKAFDACTDLGLAISYCDETDSLIVGDWTGEVRVWKAADGTRIGGLSSNPETLADRVALADKLVTERAPAVEPARAAADAATTAMAGMQKQFDETVQAKGAADTQLAAMQQQADAALAARTEATKGHLTAQEALAAAERELNAALAAHGTAVTALAQNPADEAAKKAVADQAAVVQERRTAVEARRGEAVGMAATLAQAEKQLVDMTTQRDQARLATEQLAGKVAEMGPPLDQLKQAATAAATRVADATAQLESAKAELARWQQEVAFLGQYRQLSEVIASRESAVREAEARVAEAQSKRAADEKARDTIAADRAARAKEIEDLTAALAQAQQAHAGLLEKVAAREKELVAMRGSIDGLTKAIAALEAAAASAKTAVDTAPGDQELTAAHAALLQTVAAKAAQMKGMGETMTAMANEKGAWEKEAAEMLAKAEKVKGEMPAVMSKMQEIDGLLGKAAAAVADATAVVQGLEAQAAEKQKDVDAANGELATLQGLPPAAP